MPTPKKALRNLIEKESAEWIDRQPAWLGDYSHTVLTDVAGTFFARLINGKVIKVYNQARVPPTYDLQVLIGRRKSLPRTWQIIEVIESYTIPAANGEIEYHHQQHEETGPDRVNLDRKQINQFTVRVYDGLSFIVKVGGGVFVTASGLAQVNTQLVDLSSYVGVKSAYFVTIETDEAGVLTVNDTGVDFGSPLVGNVSYVPAPPAGQTMLSYILLSEAYSELLDEHIRVPMPLGFNASGYLTSVSWGDIVGTLADQTDLQAALDALVPTTHLEPLTANVPREFDAWHIEGALAATTDAALAIWATKAMKLAACYIFGDDTGSAGSTIVDINLNGTTIFTTSGNRPELEWDDSDGWALSGDPEVIDVAIGDKLTIDIDQVATGAAGLRVALMEMTNELIYDLDNKLVMVDVEN